jgi:hypothetical protein
VVDLLERALPPAELRRTAAEDQHRRVVLARGRHRADPVRHARPGRERRDPDRARHLRPSLGRERGGLLVADVDDLDALGAAAVIDREDVAAREREQLADPVRAQALSDQAPAVDFAFGLGLARHAGARR